jgi:DNA-binding transcriptional MerR regulator
VTHGSGNLDTLASRFYHCPMDRGTEQPPQWAVRKLDGPGFVYAGQKYDDFSDRPDLPPGIRAQVARWARLTGGTTPVPDRLPPQDPIESVRDELQELFEQDQNFVRSPFAQKVLAHFSQEDQFKVLRPQSILKRELVWPLRTGDAAVVLGDVTENQLRDWDEAGLVVPARRGKGEYRAYFRRHLIQAILVARSLAAGWSIAGLADALQTDPNRAESTVDDLRALAAIEERSDGSPTRETMRDRMALRDIPLFATLSDEQLWLVSSFVQLRVVKSGSRIQQPGERMEFVVVLDGEVSGYSAGEPQAAFPVERYGPGSVIGELSAFRLAYAEYVLEANGVCTLGILTTEDAQALVMLAPQIGIHLAAHIADRLRRLTHSVQEALQETRSVLNAAKEVRGLVTSFGSHSAIPIGSTPAPVPFVPGGAPFAGDVFGGPIPKSLLQLTVDVEELGMSTSTVSLRAGRRA